MRPFGRSASRRFARRPQQVLLALAVLLVLAALRHWHPELFDAPSHNPHDGDSPQSPQRIARVVDGDTLVLAGDEQRVRLIGVNAPETVKPNHPVEPWGPEASRFTNQFLAGGEVRLEFDGPKRDKYGRLLAYVWVGRRMLNEELLRAGLARLETQYSFSSAMKSRLQRAQDEARAARIGIWSPDSRHKVTGAAP